MFVSFGQACAGLRKTQLGTEKWCKRSRRKNHQKRRWRGEISVSFMRLLNEEKLLRCNNPLGGSSSNSQIVIFGLCASNFSGLGIACARRRQTQQSLYKIQLISNLELITEANQRAVFVLSVSHPPFDTPAPPSVH